MVRRRFVLALVAVTLGGMTLNGAPAQTFGKGVSLTAVTSLEQVAKTPTQFEGRTVRIEGVVTAVCTEMGCWMALGTKDAPGASTMLVKVQDGVIVFPVTAKGKRAAAQGVIQRITAADPEAKEAARELAKAEKQSSATTVTSWQLKATGAVVF